MNAPIAAKPTPWRPTTRPGSQMRPTMLQKEGRSPTSGATPARGSTIAIPASGTDAQASMTPANPVHSSRATPMGLPIAKAP